MSITFTDTSIKPEKITRYTVTNHATGVTDTVDIATFGYKEGKQCMRANNIQQIVTIEGFSVYEGYIVHSGKILVRLKPTDYPDMRREHTLPG